MRDPLLKQFKKIYRKKIKDGWHIVYAPVENKFCLQLGYPMTGFTYYYFSPREINKIKTFIEKMERIR